METTLDNEPQSTPFVPTRESQIALLDQIREKVMASPEHLDMNSWHSSCGTTHCLAGWAQTLNEHPTELDRAESVGRWLLPDFAKFFHGRTELIKKWLESRAYALDHGKVVRSGNVWVDAGCNFYDGTLSQEDAEKMSASNVNCMYCSRCSDCSRCSRCSRCSGCSDCSDCSRCSGCSGCSDCSDCSRCSGCSGCSRCSRCSDCSDCSDCKNEAFETGLKR